MHFPPFGAYAEEEGSTRTVTNECFCATDAFGRIVLQYTRLAFAKWTSTYGTDCEGSLVPTYIFLLLLPHLLPED